MMRAVYGSTVLYPCDPNRPASSSSNVDLKGSLTCAQPRKAPGPVFPPRVPHRQVQGGQAVSVRSGDNHCRGHHGSRALKAHAHSRARNQCARDRRYSVKPIDRRRYSSGQGHARSARGGGDHWPEGGLGDAVLEALSGTSEILPKVVKLAVRKMPGSGTPAQLLDAAGISAEHIVEAVKSLA